MQTVHFDAGRFSSEAIEGGFADPVFQSQAVFTALMQAMACPGRRKTLDDCLQPPAPLDAGMAAVALTLCDPDTPVWLSPALRTDAVRAWLAFHAGCPLRDDAAKAAFVLCAQGDTPPAHAALHAGTQEYPDRAATLVLALPALDGGAILALTGPGIETETAIAPVGLPDGFVAARAANRALFPRGVDVVLVAHRDLVALPRTTVVAHADGASSNAEAN
ncbi:phosphonate C-P lyase system protein PhnH [Stappia sp. ES.058]|uniref:phosphonate C-P lyase system protein PhnH n=1 Tax=Stappia sp. ES.058 TaxID=1881061 RepID=UPI00087B3966|nr:phosphonate C-P lyase system protein PhnH [Stappia sp. ES.058]SDU31072.1 alpha-D-ribose 1-methylphosphonate 5-triphosphate synthase subunit PhnH [Stappia sp. ES.058]